MLTIDATLTQLIVATLIPLAVGVVTKLSSPSWLKSVTMIVLSAVATVVTVSIQADGVAVISKETAIQFLQSVTQSVAIFYGVWKPTGVAAAVQQKTENVGL